MPARRRPFGVLVVAFIQLATVVSALVGLLTSWTMPWEGTLAVYLQDHSWARLAIMSFGAAVVVAAIGMWQLRSWGWALMVSLVGVSLVFDLVNWWESGGQPGNPLYLRLLLDVVSAFYLNTSAVQDAFRPHRDPVARPITGTGSAGRVDT